MAGLISKLRKTLLPKRVQPGGSGPATKVGRFHGGPALLRWLQQAPGKMTFCLVVCLNFNSGAGGALVGAAELAGSVFQPVPLTRQITGVQPGTGIVLWDDSEHAATDAIQLEFSYVGYGDVVTGRDVYNWTVIDRKLAAIAARKHQAILRFFDTYPGKPAAVPAYLAAIDGYRPVTADSEGQPTGFPDWSHPEYQRMVLAFFEQFAARYDTDPRLAYLQVGFGLWSEYHIYDGPETLGKTFPSREFQIRFLNHLTQRFRETPWMISVDAADEDRAPFTRQPELKRLRFGLFDDSFLCKQHAKENEPNWNTLGRDRWQASPAGGEFSYCNSNDQRRALAARGPNGERFEAAAARFHLTFMIGNDQPQHAGLDRLRQAGMACGYRFRLTRLETDGRVTRGTITNTGIAPLYFDAWPSVGDIRSITLFKCLLPGEKLEFSIPAGAATAEFGLTGSRLVPGQRIEFETP